MPTTTAVTPAQQITELLSAGSPDTLKNPAAATAFIRPLLDAGCPLLPLRTDSGNQKAPRYAGGFNSATVSHDTWDGWITDIFNGAATADGHPALGIGMRVGANVVVVDVDDPDEHTAWTAFCANLGLGDPGNPTVSTPGSLDTNGTMKHHSGGHWWFHVAPGDVPGTLNKTIRIDAEGRTDSDIPTHEAVDSATGQTTRVSAPSFALMLTTGFVVIPPTRRDEGPYTLTGPVHDVPAGLRGYLSELADQRGAAEAQAVRDRLERQRRPRTDSENALDEAIDAWGETHSWADILLPHSWEITGHDRCGCEQWRRPGSTATKSATAHECSVGTYLKVWTDNAGIYGLEKDVAYSKMQASAAMNHGGDTRAALTSAGITSGLAKIDSMAFDLRERFRAINEKALDLAEKEGVSVDDVTTSPELELPYNEATYPQGHPNDPRLMEKIFGFNEVTRAIYHAARGRTVYTPPMSMLFTELMRAGRLSGQDTHTELNDQLSVYVALCARSGGGKSVTMKMLQRHSPFTRGAQGFQRNLNEAAPPGDLVIAGLASGQAMVDGLADEVLVPGDDESGRPPEKKVELRSPAVLTIVEDELDNLSAKSQGGSTLSNTVLSAWSCDSIGDLSRTHGMRMINGVENPYTVYLAGGIQPARAASMVGRAAVSSGLAQRVFFLATEDPWFDDPVLGAPRSDAAVVDPPAAGGKLMVDDEGNFALPAVPVGVTVGFCDEMRHAMRLQNLHTARGDQDPGETHLTRIRFRLACLMALHSGDRDVTPEVWEWTSLLMEHRRRCLAYVQQGAEAAAQDEADEQATRDKRGRGAAELATENDVQEVAEALLAKIPASGVTVRELSRKASKRQQVYFNDSLGRLRLLGFVRSEASPRGSEVLYPVHT